MKVNGAGQTPDWISGTYMTLGVTVDADYVYWTNYDGNSIGRANLDGTSVNQSWITGCTNPTLVTVNSSHVFWTGNTNGCIGRANLDGTEAEQNWISGGASLSGITVNTSHVFWTNASTDTIGRANLDGSDVTHNWITGCGSPDQVVVDSTYVYWANNGGHSIGRANIDGSGVTQDWITGCNQPAGLTIRNGYLHWSNNGNGTIGRAGIDGSGIDQAWMTLASPYSAYYLASDGIYSLTVNLAGSGSGTITSDPSGIDCGSDCDEWYVENTIVTLTGNPDSGFAFDGWTINSPANAECPGNGSCNLTMNEDYLITATFSPDGDNDGVSDDIENQGPNGGDGNNDGTLDYLQGNVATFPNINDDYVTLETSPDLSLVHVTVLENPSPEDKPEGVSFPGGFYHFEITGTIASDEAVVLNMILHNADRSINAFYKYGPTTDNTDPHWYDFSFDGATGAEVVQETDQTLVNITFLDGQRGDDDLEVNSRIMDDSAPASVNNATNGSGGVGCFISVSQSDVSPVVEKGGQPASVKDVYGLTLLIFSVLAAFLGVHCKKKSALK